MTGVCPVVGVGVGFEFVGLEASAGTVMTIDPLETDVDELVAETVNVNVPDPVGVPDSTPVVACKVRPGGRLPELTEKVGDGLPVAVNV